MYVNIQILEYIKDVNCVKVIIVIKSSVVLFPRLEGSFEPWGEYNRGNAPVYKRCELSQTHYSHKFDMANCVPKKKVFKPCGCREYFIRDYAEHLRKLQMKKVQRCAIKLQQQIAELQKYMNDEKYGNLFNNYPEDEECPCASAPREEEDCPDWTTDWTEGAYVRPDTKNFIKKQ